MISSKSQRLSVVRVVAGRNDAYSKPPSRDRPAKTAVTDIFKTLETRSPAQQVDLNNIEHAKRPPAGRAGRPMQVLTNLFKLQLPDPSKRGSTLWYQYSVEVVSVRSAPPGKASAKTPTPRKAPRDVAEKAVRALAQKEGWDTKYAYDGAALLYSVNDNLQTAQVEVQDEPGSQRSPDTFQIKLARVASHDPWGAHLGVGATASSLQSWQPVQTAVELIARAQPAADVNSVRAGSSGYANYQAVLQEPPNNYGKPPVLPPWLKMLSGFRSTARLTQGGVMLAVDNQVIGVMQDGPLLTTLRQMTRAYDVEDLQSKLKGRAAADVDIKGVQVKLTHTGFEVKLDRVAPSSARQLKFDYVEKEGVPSRKISVMEFFKAKYNIVLKYPDMPCVLSTNGAALPIELCSVVKSQRRTQLKDARAQADMIRAVAVQAVLKPPVRLARIKELMNKTFGNLKGAVATAFGLGMVKPSLVQAPARLIPGPALSYSINDRSVMVSTDNDGEWRPPRGSPMREVGTWYSGAILVMLPKTSQNEAGVQSFWKVLEAQLRAAGVQAPKGIPLVWSPVSSKDDVEEALTTAAQRAKKACGVDPSLMMVIMPDRAASSIYTEIKAVGDGRLGCATQCVDPFKANVTRPPREAKMQTQYCDQLALKINTKLGGHTNAIAGPATSWAPVFGGRQFMAIGVDVSRSASGSGPGKDVSLSYAAAVGTYDAAAVMSVRPQLIVQAGPNNDLVYGMEHATRNLLGEYQMKNFGDFPEILLVFRDGVSESMYDEMLALEFTDIKRAAKALPGAPVGYDPKIVFVVVSKTHNVRFFPVEGDREFAHRSGNVKPGTVIDQEVCDANAFDFYLNSHAGILGTNRVPRYSVLVDEVGMSADSMQLLTHWMCHTYALCHRSVSVPPIVMYADKAAARAGQVAGAVTFQLLEQAKASQRAEYQVLDPAGLQGNQSMAYV